MRRVGGTVAMALIAIASGGATPASAGSLTGKVIAINPGHNGGNGGAPSTINRTVPIGQGQRKACDTTGTATNGGYSEAAYNWDVALRTRRILRHRGATVVFTRDSNKGVGPCIDERARIANRAHADATVSIHADGAPADARGFHVIEPSLIRGLTDDIFDSSHRLALALRGSFRFATKQPYANYIGRNAIDRRSDLGGLRLADVPSVFIECGNMRNATDAAQFGSSRWRLKAARGIANGIERFLSR